MTTYAPVPAYAQKRLHSNVLVGIVGAHAAVIAAVMMIKMDLPRQIFDPPTIIYTPVEPLPPPPRQDPKPKSSQQHRMIDHPETKVQPPKSEDSQVFTFPEPKDPGPVTLPDPTPLPDPLPKTIVRTGPRFATPASELRPPYPPEKLNRQEEASLRLRLSIDERGRVTAVDPVGAVDPAFLAAARKHILRHWRYQPATEDRRPVASSTVITLRFELDD
jgi:protein TonB